MRGHISRTCAPSCVKCGRYRHPAAGLSPPSMFRTSSRGLVIVRTLASLWTRRYEAQALTIEVDGTGDEYNAGGVLAANGRYSRTLECTAGALHRPRSTSRGCSDQSWTVTINTTLVACSRRMARYMSHLALHRRCLVSAPKHKSQRCLDGAGWAE